MAAQVPLTARNSESIALPAGVPTTINLPVNGARDWMGLLKNDGANPVNSGTVARSPDGVHFEDPVAIPGANLPTAGATCPVDGEHSPIVTLRLVLTSTLGTTLTVSLGGL